MKVALVLGVAVLSAVGIPFAFAEALPVTAVDPFAGWGGFLSSSPLVAGLIYVFKEVMAANRAREVDALAREESGRAHELRRDEIFAARDDKMSAAIAKLASAVETLNVSCVRGRNDLHQNHNAGLPG